MILTTIIDEASSGVPDEVSDANEATEFLKGFYDLSESGIFSNLLQAKREFVSTILRILHIDMNDYMYMLLFSVLVCV